MTTTIVNSTSALLAALKSAHAGDTIDLASGNYSGVNIKNVNFTSAVTVTSLDSSHQAVLTDFALSSSHGLDFSNLILAHAGTTNQRVSAFTVYNSSMIGFHNLDVHGTSVGGQIDSAKGLVIQQSSNVQVSDSTFANFRIGIGEFNNTGITISGNTFHNLESDGIDNAGSSQVEISGNSFSDFHPVGLDHPDAMQFWTTNTKTSARDIVIRDNVVNQGSGAAFQSVFMSARVATPYYGVEIIGNRITNGQNNGICVGGAVGLTISGNVLTKDSSHTAIPRIVVLNSADVLVSGNTAPIFAHADLTALRQYANHFGYVSVPKDELQAKIPTPVKASATGYGTAAPVGAGGGAKVFMPQPPIRVIDAVPRPPVNTPVHMPALGASSFVAAMAGLGASQGAVVNTSLAPRVTSEPMLAAHGGHYAAA